MRLNAYERSLMKKKVKKSEPHISIFCDNGKMRCGVKLTDENRTSYQGWAVCKDCYDKLNGSGI